jgi:hypothetical protein
MRELVRAPRRGPCRAPGTSAAVGLCVAPWLPLRPAGLDQAASPLARRAQIRTGNVSSRPQSPARWPALSGRSPAARRRRRTDQTIPRLASKRGASKPTDTLLGKAGGAAAVSRTLASTICRAIGPMLVARPSQLRDASPVRRFRPAHQRLINRRHDGRVSGPAHYSLRPALERKPQFRLPATWKGGHENG